MYQKLMTALALVTLYGVGYLVWREVEKPERALAVVNQATVTHTYNCELVRVLDANTVEVDVNLGFDLWLRNHRFELLDVDLRDLSNDHVRDLSAELERLLVGRKLTLQSVQNKKGSFDRWMGRLHADGRCVNDQINSLMTLDE